jgi:hypothetical protein
MQDELPLSQFLGNWEGIRRAGASNSPGFIPSLASLVRDYLTGRDLRWVREQRG